MYFKTALACVLCLASPLVWGQAASSSSVALKKLEIKLQTATQQSVSKPTQNIVLKRAEQYIYSYYGKKDFSDPQWVRVQNFLTWLKQNETRLEQQFRAAMGDKWKQFSADKQEVVLGAWLGMKYAVEKIGGTTDKSFPIVLEEKIWNTECGDYSYRRQIYCSKGDFISKVNISLHETVHLLPYLKRTYRPGYDFEDSYREKYTVASQLRYALPAKKTSNYNGGTRSFFPILKTKQKFKLLNEYAEGIAALIDYEKIWASTPWPSHEDNSNESLDMRLRTVVFDKLGVSSDNSGDFYSPAVNNYFNDVGWQIANTYCKNLPAERNAQIEFIHACMDEHAADILQLAAQKLQPLVSKKIPPVPAEYQ